MKENSFIYLRGLKHAAFTVFCVEDGQKSYYVLKMARNPILTRSSMYEYHTQVVSRLSVLSWNNLTMF